MDSRNKKRLTSETSINESKPKQLSAWERRKLYSKQMYDKQRTDRNSENKTSTVPKSNPGKQQQNPQIIARIDSKMVKRTLSLVKDKNIMKKENQVGKKHKPITDKDSLFPKKTPPKRKWKSGSSGKENSEPKKSKSSFPLRRTSPRQHSFNVIIEKDTLLENSSMPKMRRSASFTIDKGTNETNSLEGGNITQNASLEAKEMSCHKNDFAMKATTNAESDVAVTETILCQKNLDTMPEVCSTTESAKQHSKTQSLKKKPLKSGRKISLLVKKDKFVKPSNFSGKKLNRREQLMTWKQQPNNNSTSISNRRVTCGPAILGSVKQLSVKQVTSKVNQPRNRRTLTSIDILGEKRVSRTSKSSLFTAISSKPHEQNSRRLSVNQRKNGNSLTMPMNNKCPPQLSRKSCSNILSKLTVAANVERSVANRKTPIKACGFKKSILKSESIKKKANRSDAKRKSISYELLDRETKKDTVSEQYDSSNVVDSGKKEIKEQLKYDSIAEEEGTFEEHIENNLIIETTDGATTGLENDMVINTPRSKNIASSRKKSVCFDVPLLGSTPGKTLPKTPKRSFTLRERLQLWLDNKGHSISNFRHVKCFGYHLSNMKPKKNLRHSQDKTDIIPVPEEIAPTLGESPILRTRSSSERSLDSLSDNTFDVNEVLEELKILLDNGHPSKDITEWLDELVKYLPPVEENPQYWICRSLVAELQSGVNGAIAVYHAALDKKVQCSQVENEHEAYTVEICKALDGLLRRYTENFNKNVAQPQTPRRQEKLNEQIHLDTPREPLIDKKNMFNSSVIKYGVSYNTPSSYKSSVKAVVTPVRRSARLSRTPIPKSIKSDIVLASLTDLPQNIKENVLFRENTALILD